MSAKFDKILGKLREVDEGTGKGGGLPEAPSDGKTYGR